MLKILKNPIEENKDEIFEKCPECKSDITTQGYQKICSSCGLIVDEELIQSSYKMFDNEGIQFNQGKQYVYIGKTLETVGNLGTYIDFYDRKKYFADINGRKLSLEMQDLFSRLKNKYSKFSKIKNQETDYRIMNILANTTQYLKLSSDIRKDAAYNFRKIKSMNKNIRNNISLIAFCIFFAVRNQKRNAPVTIKEISEAFQMLGHRVNPRLILRDGVLYKKLLNPPEPHKSEDYVERLVNNIINYSSLSERMKKKKSIWTIEEYQNKLYNQTLSILDNIDLYQRGGRNPFIFAGAAVYCADKVLAKDNKTKCILTQQIASKAMGIAEYSIRDHYVSIFKKILFNNPSNEKI